MLAHILGVFSGFLAPAIMMLIKKESKFVLFHSLQSLAWHFALYVFLVGGAMLTLMFLFATGQFPPSDAKAEPPVAFFVLFGLVWLVAMAAGIANLIFGVAYGIKANKGEWAKLPLLGEFVLKKMVF